MIRSTCSCGAEFETDSLDGKRLWREWQKLHSCPDRDDEPEYNSQANTQTETLPLGFAPTMHPGRQDPALDE